MSTGASADGPPSGANPLPKADNPEEPKSAPTTNETQTKTENAAPTGEKKLTNAELKAKAKAEKQARRAQAKQTKESAPPAGLATPSGPPANDTSKGGKGKAKPDGAPASSSGTPGRPTASKAPTAPVVVEPKITIPECFSHLSMARRLPYTQADKDVHPTILALGQQMATFEIDESIFRLQATLIAFKKVIEEYTTPPGSTLARHLTPHILNPQIDYLSACRPMCFSMGNAIRWLKLQVSKIDPDGSETDAKKQLCSKIDTFIQERITLADSEIIRQGANEIEDGQMILVFGHSTLVERTLLRASTLDGKKLQVIVVDDPYERKGQTLAKNLAAEGIIVSYTGDLGGLTSQVQFADQVLLGAEAMFSNGAIYGRAGTCDIAMAAQDFSKKVVVLCESINITERVAIDSLTHNEIDPDRCTSAAFRLLYDTTLSEHVTTVVTEILGIGSSSVSHILRKLEDSN
ncbi:translation initiation factor eIF-2B subunit delta [Xylariaceae sp. FL0255]|nr:translation initiation factor eIF-2B subunit delta [Xylariaceae sp. FL0255]